MRIDVAERADALIDRHWLHFRFGSFVVNLRALEREFVPVLIPLGRGGVKAAAMPTPAGASKEEWPAYVFLDADQDEHDRRLYYAHEIGHLLCGHPGSQRTLEVCGRMHDRDEREAWEVAALLLIPHEAWGWGEPAAEVAAKCEVPAWLAEMYPWRMAA